MLKKHISPIVFLILFFIPPHLMASDYTWCALADSYTFFNEKTGDPQTKELTLWYVVDKGEPCDCGDIPENVICSYYTPVEYFETVKKGGGSYLSKPVLTDQQNVKIESFTENYNPYNINRLFASENPIHCFIL